MAIQVVTISLPGAPGPAGPANVLTIGTVTTGAPGTTAQVSLNGSPPTQELNFVIPQGPAGATGATGAQGPQGPAGTAGAAGRDGTGIQIAGSVAAYSNLPTGLTSADAGKAYIVNADGKLYIWSGTSFPSNGNGQTFTGPAGPANTLTIGTVTTGAASASITGTAPTQTLNLTLPQGPAGATGSVGPAGPATSLAIGTVSTGAPGSPAGATITGAVPNLTLNLTLPQGDVGPIGLTGAQGAPGQGVVAGGAVGDILTKNSVTDYDTKWSTPQSANVNGAIVKRDSGGNVAFFRAYVDNTITPVATNELTPKQYVDGVLPVVSAGANVTVSSATSNGRTTYTVSSTGGGSGSSIPGYVLLDAYSGATDDDKLAAAIADVKTYTQKPAIMFPARLVTLTRSVNMFDGLKLIGPPVVGFQNVERSSGGLNPTRVRINCGVEGSAFLIPPAAGGSTYNVNVRDLSFESTNNNTQFLYYPVATGTMFACGFHNLSFNSFKSVLGSATNAAAFTLCSTTGNWNVTTALGTQINLAGSDNLDLWCSGLLNLGPSGNGTLSGAGGYLMIIQTAKSNYGNVYITADDNWRALKLTGTDSFQVGNRLRGFVIEGRNTNDPSPGALISVAGGGWILDGFDLNYAMTSPSTYTDRTDRGYIHMTSGTIYIMGGTTDRAAGVAETVPVVFISGGEATVEKWKRCTKGGSWTGRPVVQQTTAGLVLANDSTVTVTTAP